MAYGRSAKTQLLASAGTEQKEKLKTFGASEAWARKFLVRHNLRSTKAQDEEAGSADPGGTTAPKGWEDIREECRKYKPENIYNVEETGIYFGLLPQRTYLTNRKGRRTTRGRKGMQVKDRVSGYLCANATGSVKVPVSVIGRSAAPSCFRLRPSPVKYFSQVYSWSDSRTFGKWWREVFLPFVRKQTKLPVLLVIGECMAGRPLLDPEGQVQTIAYSPDRWSRRQPMDVGIIAVAKRHYRRRLMHVRAAIVSEAKILKAQTSERGLGQQGMAGLMEGYQATVLDAAELLEAAWADVTQSTVVRCWMKAEVLSVEQQADLINASETSVPHNGEQEGVEGLTAALNALSARVHEAAEVSGVHDKELCDMLANIDMVAGQAAPQAAIDAVQAWAGLEELEEIREAVRYDARDEMHERVGGTFVDNTDLSDDEATVVAGTGAKVDVSTVSEVKGFAKPSFARVCSQFYLLEKYAQECANTEARHALRKARMSFLEGFATTPTKRVDIKTPS